MIDEPIAREQIRPDDDVGDAGLVLEREEDESFRGARPLPRDDHAGDAHAPPLPRGLQIDGAQHAAHRQLVAAQRHRMPADGQPGAGIVGDQALGLGHRLQRAARRRPIDATAESAKTRSQSDLLDTASLRSLRALRVSSCREQLAGWADGALGLPQRRAAIVAERVQRADVGERHELVAAQAGARDEIVERGEASRRRARAASPVVRAVVAEHARPIHRLEHRLRRRSRTSGRQRCVALTPLADSRPSARPRSSQPHSGMMLPPVLGVACASARRVAIAFPTSCRSPLT